MNDIKIDLKQQSNERWSEIIAGFNDANIYQTKPYGELKWGKENIGHIVLTRRNKIIGASLYVIKKLPIIPLSIVYIYRGPLWRKKDEKDNIENLNIMIKAIYKEFIQKKKFVVRILPNEYLNNAFSINEIFTNISFKPNSKIKKSLSIIVDLLGEQDELLKTFTKKWKENLRRSKKYEMVITQDTGIDTFKRFLRLYQEMHKRKNYAEFVDINMFLEMQKRLNDKEKLKIMIASIDEEDIAGIVWSDIGNTGIPLFSATGNKGLKYRGSYLLRWKMTQDLRSCGVKKLDQGGINKKTNYGGYKFKSGMGGKEIEFIGPYDAYPSTITKYLITAIDMTLNLKKKIKLMMHK